MTRTTRTQYAVGDGRLRERVLSGADPRLLSGMGRAVWKRMDARSAAILVGSGGSFILPFFAFGSPGALRPGSPPVFLVVWLCASLAFVFTLRVGRLTDRQFVIIGLGGMVGIAVIASMVTDPAAARAIIAFLSALPAIAAMASTKRVTAVFTAVAIAFAVLFSLYWSTSIGARFVAAGASVLTVCVPVFLVAALRSSLEFAVEKVAQLGELDPLTGALNRRGLVRRHARVFDRCIRDGQAVGYLLIDVDNFKFVNDSRGHAAGDEVLVNTVRAIADAAPRDSLVSRIGGEEFVVLCAVDSVADMSAKATRIRVAVAAAGEVTVSVGAVFAPIGAACDGPPNISEIIDALIRHADRGVYLAKRQGRDRVVLTTAPPIRWRRGVPDDSPADLSDLSHLPGRESLSELVRWARERHSRNRPQVARRGPTREPDRAPDR